MLKARKARKRDDRYPMPNSSQFVFPMIVAPDAFSRRTTVASKGDWKSFGRMAYAKIKINTATPTSRGAREGKHSGELTSKHGRGARRGHIFSAYVILDCHRRAAQRSLWNGSSVVGGDVHERVHASIFLLDNIAPRRLCRSGAEEAKARGESISAKRRPLLS